ncbi:MAG: Fumble domain-containing protein [archaeon]
MIVLGIDFGASLTKAVLVEDGKIIRRHISEQVALDVLLRKFSCPRVAITGGRSKFMKSFQLIDEISAIGAGGASLGMNDAIIVSAGTGTCIVDPPARHLGGTGVGGGTLLGLSRLILNTGDIAEIGRLAEKGNPDKVDLSVSDIIGSGIGAVPGEATASNFGKLASSSREDLAAAILKLVAETVSMMAVLAARGAAKANVVLIGTTATLKPVQAYAKKIGKIFKVSFKVPKDAEYATAYGAAILAK